MKKISFIHYGKSCELFIEGKKHSEIIKEIHLEGKKCTFPDTVKNECQKLMNLNDTLSPSRMILLERLISADILSDSNLGISRYFLISHLNNGFMRIYDEKNTFADTDYTKDISNYINKEKSFSIIKILANNRHWLLLLVFSHFQFPIHRIRYVIIGTINKAFSIPYTEIIQQYRKLFGNNLSKLEGIYTDFWNLHHTQIKKRKSIDNKSLNEYTDNKSLNNNDNTLISTHSNTCDHNHSITNIPLYLVQGLQYGNMGCAFACMLNIYTLLVQNRFFLEKDKPFFLNTNANFNDEKTPTNANFNGYWNLWNSYIRSDDRLVKTDGYSIILEHNNNIGSTVPVSVDNNTLSDHQYSEIISTHLSDKDYSELYENENSSLVYKKLTKNGKMSIIGVWPNEQISFNDRSIRYTLEDESILRVRLVLHIVQMDNLKRELSEYLNTHKKGFLYREN